MRTGSERPTLADWAILAGALVLCIGLLSTSRATRITAARYLRDTLFRPYQLVLAYGSCPVDAYGEIETLREKLATAVLERAAVAEARSENARLREMLAFAERSPRRLVPARIVGRTQDRFGETLIAEPAGGARPYPGQTVVGVSGLVGCVVGLQGERCLVRTLRNGALQVSARVAETRSVGLLHWHAREGRLALTGVPIQRPVPDGAEVITSGEGMVFPPGLPIGRIVSVADDSTALVKRIRVAPHMELGRVEEVFLIGE